MLEPTGEQWIELEDIQGILALAQFVVIKNQEIFEQYRVFSEKIVSESGGKRI